MVLTGSQRPWSEGQVVPRRRGGWGGVDKDRSQEAGPQESSVPPDLLRSGPPRYCFSYMLLTP